MLLLQPLHAILHRLEDLDPGTYLLCAQVEFTTDLQQLFICRQPQINRSLQAWRKLFENRRLRGHRG